MSDEWVDDAAAAHDEWVDDAGGEWVDDGHPAPKPEEPGWGSKALDAGMTALKLLGKGTKARDMVIAGNPVSRAAWLAYRLANRDKKLPEQLVTGQDVKDLVTTLDGGLDASQLMERGGMDPKIAGPAGLITDIALPGDPGGALLGKAFTGFKVGSKSVPGLTTPFRNWGLSGAVPKGMEEAKEAALRATLKEMGVGGSLKGQRKIVQKAIDASHRTVDESIKAAAKNGATADSPALLADWQTYIDDFSKTSAAGGAGHAPEYAANVAKEAGRSSPAAVPLEFINKQRKAIGPTTNKAEQTLREMLRAHQIAQAGGTEGAIMDKALTQEGQLIQARKALRASMRAPFNATSLIAPTVGAAFGGAASSNFGDDFDFGPLTQGAVWGALLAKGLTSPYALTKGADLFGKYGGRAAAQSAYRLLPKEPVKENAREEKSPWSGEEQPDPWSVPRK